ncbi:MAG: formyltransferase [Planctomycetota bacterium]
MISRKTAVLFGYHNIGCAGLRTLHDLGLRVELVVTHEDDPNENQWFDSLAATAAGLGIEAITPARPGDPEVVAALARLAPDYILSFYYRHMIPTRVLEMARIAALNLHGSLLPRYRGRCPVNWVILNQERETGVTLHYMTGKADAGDIVAQHVIPIAPRETPLTLFAKVEREGVQLLREIYPALASGKLPRTVQDASRATYYGGRRPEDGRIDWNQPAAAIDALVRAVTHPYPGAFTTHRGQNLLIWESSPLAPAPGVRPGAIAIEGGRVLVGTGSGRLELKLVQQDGEPELAAGAWARSRARAGEMLGEPAAARQASPSGGQP